MIKIFFKAWKEGRLINKTIKEKKYYTHIDDLPVYNFANIMKGEYEYLWMDYRERHKKYPKGLFQAIFSEMYFQFKYLDNTDLRNRAAIAEYKYKFAATNNFRWKNQANTLIAKLEKEITTDFDLNDFTDYIEQTFSNPVGSIDVHRISTSKAFNNYHKAIKINKKRKHANS